MIYEINDDKKLKDTGEEKKGRIKPIIKASKYQKRIGNNSMKNGDINTKITATKWKKIGNQIASKG